MGATRDKIQTMKKLVIATQRMLPLWTTATEEHQDTVLIVDTAVTG